jgi:hypothetical protein
LIAARFAPGDEPALGILCVLIGESYALAAPKKLPARAEKAPDRNPVRRR